MRIRTIHKLVAAVGLLGVTACDVEVINPNIVEASSINPAADATTFARSAMQNFVTAYGAGSGGTEPMIVSAGWYTNEIRVGDTFPTRNEFGRRIVSTVNGNSPWTALSRAMATSHDVIDLLRGVTGEDSNLNVARANFTAGYSLIYMGELYCQSVVRVGAPMALPQTMDSAIARFQRAIAVGTAVNASTANSAAVRAEGAALANASRVGLARAHLNKGENAQAIAAASAVPAGFEYFAEYADDASNRARVGNGIYGFGFGGGRESIVVGPEWRAHADAGDPRITYFDAGKDAQDGILRLYTQLKYPSYASPIRLASKIEADYIAAEAGTTADQLAVIAARRTAAGVGAYTGPTDAASVLQELLLQKHLDLWLEGQRMGDWRRNPGAVSYIIPPGNNYYKPQVGIVEDGTCLPVPLGETSNNPNF